MTTHTPFGALILLVAFASPTCVHAAEGDARQANAAASTPTPSVTAEALPTDPIELRAVVAELDRQMFDAYNAHDVDRLMAMFADDLEFYHDTGGLLGHEQVRAGFTSVFANNKDIRRELVPGSLEVYPIQGYGAIQLGAHAFCHTENGALVCGTFRFLQIWQFKDGAWKVTRETSYGHQLSPPSFGASSGTRSPLTPAI